MTQPSKLMIGTLAGGFAGMVQVENLSGTNLGIRTYSVNIVPVYFSRYTRLGNGYIRGQGYRQAEWHLNGIRNTHWDAIYTYKVDQSTPLCIRTLAEDGKTFHNYEVLATFPETPVTREHTTGVVLDFTLKFTQMVQFADI